MDEKSIKENMSSESKDVGRNFLTVDSVFSPLLRMMKWMACYTPFWDITPGDRTPVIKIHFVFSLFVIIFNWVDVFRSLRALQTIDETSGNYLVLMSLMLFIVTSTCSITVLFFAGSRNVRRLVKVFMAYHNDYQEGFCVRFLRRIVICVTIVSLAMISISTVAMAIMVITDFFPDDSVFRHLPIPLNGNSPLGIGIVICSAVTKVFSSFSLVGFSTIYGLSVFILFREYRRLSRDFRDICLNRTHTLAQEFTTLRCKYLRLTEILERANHLLGHFIFGVYGMAIPNFCFLLYGLIMVNLHLRDVFGVADLFLLMITGLGIVTWSGIKLSSKVSV